MLVHRGWKWLESVSVNVWFHFSTLRIDRLILQTRIIISDLLFRSLSLMNMVIGSWWGFHHLLRINLVVVLLFERTLKRSCSINLVVGDNQSWGAFGCSMLDRLRLFSLLSARAEVSSSLFTSLLWSGLFNFYSWLTGCRSESHFLRVEKMIGVSNSEYVLEICCDRSSMFRRLLLVL